MLKVLVKVTVDLLDLLELLGHVFAATLYEELRTAA